MDITLASDIGIHLSYLSGVVLGDGWCSDASFGLRVKDPEFAQAFKQSIQAVFGIGLRAHLYRGYWGVRTSNKTGKFNAIRTVTPKTAPEMAAWLKGFFDSEGNAQLHKVPRGQNSYHRRVAMYNTNRDILVRAEGYLESLSIRSGIRATINSKSHKGTKTVYELKLPCSKEQFTKFAQLVGSSIPRKRETLKRICDSYCADLSQSCRNAQLKGAASRKAKTFKDYLPPVLDGIRKMRADLGKEPTQRNCNNIPHYGAFVREFKHSGLLKMAA